MQDSLLQLKVIWQKNLLDKINAPAAIIGEVGGNNLIIDKDIVNLSIENLKNRIME